jgi:hypothetical protein
MEAVALHPLNVLPEEEEGIILAPVRENCTTPLRRLQVHRVSHLGMLQKIQPPHLMPLKRNEAVASKESNKERADLEGKGNCVIIRVPWAPVRSSTIPGVCSSFCFLIFVITF